jgi:excisionase family DNA binding protein
MNNSELQALADMISANVTLNHKEVLTADEAARYMGVSKSYLYKLTMQGKVPFSKPLGKMCYFNRLELEAWLMSNRVATADELQDRAQAYCAHARTFSKKKGGQR